MASILNRNNHINNTHITHEIHIMEDCDEYHADTFGWGGGVFGCTHGSGNEDEGRGEGVEEELVKLLMIGHVDWS